jgi:hypothetical protein
MLLFLAANLDSTRRPLGPVLAVTHGTRRETTIPNMTIGLAWHILKTTGGTIVWHNGGTGGYRSFLGFDLGKRVGIVALSNSAIGIDDVGFHLIDPTVPLSPPPTPKVEVAIAPAEMAPYAGVYQLTPAVQITVTITDGQMWVEATGQGKVRAYASSKRDFFIKEDDLSFTFVTDSSGATTELVLHEGGGSSHAKKLR